MPKDWCCCRAIAEFEIPFLARKREQVLRNCLVISCAGFGLAVLGFLGGYSSGTILKALPWAIWRRSDGAVAYAGVRWACNGTAGSKLLRSGIHAVSLDEPANCTKWSSMDCTSVEDDLTCSLCQNTAQVTVVPVALTVIAYLLFTNHARQRYIGKDSAQHKVMACFSAFFGGFNFLGTMVTYWQSCVKTAADDPDNHATLGAGLLCMMIGATGLKVLVGLLQLGVPVEEEEDTSREEEDDSDEDESTSLKE